VISYVDRNLTFLFNLSYVFHALYFTSGNRNLGNVDLTVVEGDQHIA
jgi:hypothetical protein